MEYFTGIGWAWGAAGPHSLRPGTVPCWSQRAPTLGFYEIHLFEQQRGLSTTVYRVRVGHSYRAGHRKQLWLMGHARGGRLTEHVQRPCGGDRTVEWRDRGSCEVPGKDGWRWTSASGVWVIFRTAGCGFGETMKLADLCCGLLRTTTRNSVCLSACLSVSSGHGPGGQLNG